MSLLLFHLVLSSFTFEGVDVKLAGRVLEWNLRRYPNGKFCGFFWLLLGVAIPSFFFHSVLKWFYGVPSRGAFFFFAAGGLSFFFT